MILSKQTTDIWSIGTHPVTKSHVKLLANEMPGLGGVICWFAITRNI